MRVRLGGERPTPPTIDGLDLLLRCGGPLPARRLALARRLLLQLFLSPPSPRRLRPLVPLLRPEGGADAKHHHDENHEERRGPRPARGRPRVGMIDEDRHQRLEEVILDLIGEARAVPKVLPVEHERVRASGGGVFWIEALASWTDIAGHVVDRLEVADASSGAVHRAEHVRTHAAQPRTRHGGPERAGQGRDLDGLEVFLARVPLPVDPEL
mmetsp:Transcript_6678/g.15224  ORF Transcript_6678/g.15224 Transcript_6678/m.15224 type:complete len:212 (+) Transcript_6678:319-954(+)